MSATAWMPFSGRHAVSIGPSLGRALKARRGDTAQPKNNKIPEREFYSFRYNFKPESVDATKVGSIEVHRGRDTTNVTVERASQQQGEGHIFRGQETTAKEADCVLIYDEETGRYTLEKLDSFIALTFDRKTTHDPRPAVSPADTGPGTPPTPSHVANTPTSRPGSSKAARAEPKPMDEVAQLLAHELGFSTAEGEDEDIPLAATTKAKSASFTRPAKTRPAPLKAIPRKEESEESEGEILEAVEAASKARPRVSEHAPPPPAMPKPKFVQRTSGPPPPLAGAGAMELPAPKPRPPAMAQAKTAEHTSTNKRRHAPDMHQETLEAGRPSQPTNPKRARPSPPLPSARQKEEREQEKEKATFSLALPMPSPAPRRTEPPTSLSFPGSFAPVTLPGASSSGAAREKQQPQLAPALDSDEERDEVLPSVSTSASVAAPSPMRVIEMEEIVPTSSPRRPSPPPLDENDEDAEGEDDEDDDMEEVVMEDALAAEMDEELFGGTEGTEGAEGAEGEDEEDFLAAAVSPVAERAALPNVGDGGDGIYGDEDDYSSSEDSDDD